MAGMVEEAMVVAMHPNMVFKGTSAEDTTVEATEDEAAAVDLVVEDLEEDSSEISEAVEIPEDTTKAVLEAQSDSKTTRSGTKTSKTSDSGRLSLFFALAPDTRHALNYFSTRIYLYLFNNFVILPYLSTAAYFRQKT